MTKEQIKEHLIKSGVKNLKEFGYPYVTNENIITDEIYKEFFKSMLNDNIGYHKRVDEVIHEILSKL